MLEADGWAHQRENAPLVSISIQVRNLLSSTLLLDLLSTLTEVS